MQYQVLLIIFNTSEISDFKEILKIETSMYVAKDTTEGQNGTSQNNSSIF